MIRVSMSHDLILTSLALTQVLKRRAGTVATFTQSTRIRPLSDSQLTNQWKTQSCLTQFSNSKLVICQNRPSWAKSIILITQPISNKRTNTLISPGSRHRSVKTRILSTTRSCVRITTSTTKIGGGHSGYTRARGVHMLKEGRCAGRVTIAPSRTIELKSSTIQTSTKPSFARLISIKSQASRFSLASMASIAHLLTVKMSCQLRWLSSIAQTTISISSTSKQSGAPTGRRIMTERLACTPITGKTSGGNQTCFPTLLNSARGGGRTDLSSSTPKAALTNTTVLTPTAGRSKSTTLTFLRQRSASHQTARNCTARTSTAPRTTKTLRCHPFLDYFQKRGSSVFRQTFISLRSASLE